MICAFSNDIVPRNKMQSNGFTFYALKCSFFKFFFSRNYYYCCSIHSKHKFKTGDFCISGIFVFLSIDVYTVYITKLLCIYH